MGYDSIERKKALHYFLGNFRQKNNCGIVTFAQVKRGVKSEKLDEIRNHRQVKLPVLKNKMKGVMRWKNI